MLWGIQNQKPYWFCAHFWVNKSFNMMWSLNNYVCFHTLITSTILSMSRTKKAPFLSILRQTIYIELACNSTFNLVESKWLFGSTHFSNCDVVVFSKTHPRLGHLATASEVARGHTLTRASSSDSKMVRYVLLPATSEAGARWPRRRGIFPRRHVCVVHLLSEGVPSREDTFLSWNLAPVSEVTRGLTLPF
jgi:hypothetical protein